MAEKENPQDTTAGSQPSSRPRRIQNFLVVWFDANIDQVNSQDCQHTIQKLHELVKEVNRFTDVDECVDFLRNIQQEKAFVISSGAMGQQIVSAVHAMPQVSVIYIFCGNKARHEPWTKAWPKIGGVFTDIKPICEALKQATLACDHNSIAMSFLAPTTEATDQNMDQLEPSFMYTQLLKEILLDIDFEQSHMSDFMESARNLFAADKNGLETIDKLDRDYKKQSPVWWYTYPSFLYSTLNRALRLMEVDWIVSMGFFIRDLHQHIAKLHKEQFGGNDSSAKFTVYRGQGLAQSDFDKIVTIRGGLLSFNNFLSTSVDRQVSMTFARHTMAKSDLVGVLFVLTIDPSIPFTPFANIRDMSYYRREEEILFSMHSIFRIGEIKQVGGNSRLCEVSLTLTSDNDPQLRTLTDHIREETTGGTGWQRLGKLMIKLGQFDQAERLYDTLPEKTTTEWDTAFLYYQLGRIKNGQGNYPDAIALYKKSIEIEEKILSPADPTLADSYSNIGLVYENQGEYFRALEYHEKALAIRQKILPPNHSDLATSYNNIGLEYKKMGEYSRALEYYEKALAIDQKTLPPNHPDLATSYNNIGLVYNKMQESSKALAYHEKALAIKQKTLHHNHPSLATSYHNIGGEYYDLRDYSKALSFFERVLDIRQRVLPANHPDLRNTKDWIADIKKKL